MKKSVVFIFLFCASILFSGCEKDDICDPNTPTTPRLIIDFYDYNAASNLKNLTNFQLQAIDSDSIRSYNAESRVEVPLKTDEDSVTFNFTLNANNPNPALVYTDKLQFNYSRSNVYVSRACGYKTVFTLNTDPSLPKAVIINDQPATNEGIWIRNIIIDTYNLETENEVHLRIYF